jgi:hypothetical protein
MNIQPLIDIKNRRDFNEAFEIAMSGAHQSLKSKWQFGKDQNLPKSYLVEFHPKSNGHTDHAWGTDELFKTLQITGQAYGANVLRTDDDSLLYLAHDEQPYYAEFIVDCLNPRFLIFHTLSNARSTNRFIFNRLTQYQPEFDLFWLPVSLLERVEKREQVTGWEASFDPLLDIVDLAGREETIAEDDELATQADDEAIDSSETIESELPSGILKHTRLHMKIQRPNALSAYRQLKYQSEIFPDVPLSSILAERYDSELDTHARALIKSNGKITGRGTDFSAYMQIVNGTLDNYAHVINTLESKYWLGLTPVRSEESIGLRLDGEPFCITFESEIDVESVIAAMFNCERPFRLMGEPEKLADNYYAVDAIDLHVGQPLAIEIAPKMMRLYLYRGTCGNTIVRILRSLQHYIISNLIHPPLEDEE